MSRLGASHQQWKIIARVNLTILSMAVAAAPAWSTPVIIPSGGEAFMSSVYGAGTGQAKSFYELNFNGTATSPSTLVVDYNAAQGSNQWLLDANGTSSNRFTLIAGGRAVVRLEDGIDMTFRESSTNLLSIYNSQSRLSFDVGAGSTLRFQDNKVAASGQSLFVYTLAWCLAARRAR